MLFIFLNLLFGPSNLYMAVSVSTITLSALLLYRLIFFTKDENNTVLKLSIFLKLLILELYEE